MRKFIELFRRNTDFGKDVPMKIIAGLGNPTDKYKGTRHNIGFMAIDRLARDHGAAVNQHKFRAMTGSCILGGGKVLLMKPLTFMNLSGESIRQAADFFKNGMKSIINHLGTDAFPRIRIGIGGERHPDMDLADYVLSRFQGKEAEEIDQALDKAAKAAELFAADRLDEAMNLYSVGKKKRAGKKTSQAEEKQEGQTEEKGSQAEEKQEKQAEGKNSQIEEMQQDQTREVTS